jgi:hypothetical protein
MLDPQPGLAKQAADCLQREKTQMAKVGDAPFTVLPPSSNQTPQDIHILQVGNARNHYPAGDQQTHRLAQHPPGIDKVLQQVGEDHGIEGPGLEGPGLRFHINGFDLIQPQPRLLRHFRHQLNAGHFMTSLPQQPAQLTATAANIEDTPTIPGHQVRNLWTGLDIIGLWTEAGLDRCA